jgi:hypothetical protein
MSQSSIVLRQALPAACVALLASHASREARINRAREMKASREEFRGSLSQLLSPEQMKEWDALRDEAMQKARARQAGRAQ